MTALQEAAAAASVVARERAEETERERRLPDELVAELRASGLLRACVPEELGGPQADPGTVLRSARELARGDASTGWCVSIAATSSLLAAWLPAEGAHEVFGDGAAVAAGVWAPRGVARPVDGGLRVSGRWCFCSGIAHSDWLFAGCLVQTDADEPAMRIVALPKAEVTIHDTWDTAGLRGTGSHDTTADDVFVPLARTLSLLDGGPRVDAPLYRFPPFGFFALSIAAAALGNARGAIEDLVELAAGKRALGARRTLAERTATQAAVAQAEASLRAAVALFDSAVGEAWDAASAATPVSIEARTAIRLAATHAVRTSADVVRVMHDLGGGTAIYASSPLQRRFRDAHTATAHFQVNAATWELAGRLLLGLPTRTETL